MYQPLSIFFRSFWPRGYDVKKLLQLLCVPGDQLSNQGPRVCLDFLSLSTLRLAVYTCTAGIHLIFYAFTLHTALSHLENKNTYVRMLFVDYTSAFITVPATLVAKLQTLGLNRSLCSWILDFLTGRSQVVRMGNNTSSPLHWCSAGLRPQPTPVLPVHTRLYSHTQL